MNKEELIKSQFPNDEFLRAAVLRIVDKCVADLEVQIEKMRCCENCNNYQHRIDHRCNTKCKNLSEWKIREK